MSTSGCVVVDGRRLEWRMAGSGSPTVVLEAGLTASASEWTTILPRLAETTRVIAMSRAGYGGSSPVPRRPAQASVADLAAVLDHLRLDSELVLVGHSWGGMLARMLAAQRPASVAALVLVDATHEGLAPMRGRWAVPLGWLGMSLAGLHARTGRLRAQLEAGKGPLGPAVMSLPPEQRAAVVDELADVRTWQQARRDHAAVAKLLREVHASPLDTPPVPVVAVVGGRARGREAKSRAMIRAAYEQWLPTLPDGRLVIAPRSGHLVPQDDEDLLVEVITDLVTERRGSGRSSCTAS